jgi:hypothetical protein
VVWSSDKNVVWPGESDMRPICCRQVFTAITTVPEQCKEVFVRNALPDSKINL